MHFQLEKENPQKPYILIQHNCCLEVYNKHKAKNAASKTVDQKSEKRRQPKETTTEHLDPYIYKLLKDILILRLHITVQKLCRRCVGDAYKM